MLGRTVPARARNCNDYNKYRIFNWDRWIAAHTSTEARMRFLLLLAVFALHAPALSAQPLRIYFIDVDQADATLIVSPSGQRRSSLNRWSPFYRGRL